MCGIAGIFNLRAEAVSQPLLKKMNDRQYHRGPDDEGYFVDGAIGLAHRRLSIIDIAGGHQPMLNQQESVVVVFNGEIYNFQAITDELKAKGYVFQHHGDTETIIHAWSEWGPECVHRFRGMFAFAIWDRQQQRLFLARDRLGIKPLHYAVLANGDLVFGSELKVLAEHPAFRREISPEAVEDFLALGYVPDPKTIFKQVYKLEAGHAVSIEVGQPADRIQPYQYWDLPWQAEPLTASEVQDELIDRLREAVDIRMIAEVPLGSFLSGGVDSSAVVALMSQLQSDPVHTCAIGFDVPEFNESEFAQRVADRYHTEHHLEVVDHENFDLIDRLIDLYDEPYADSSALPTYRVCEVARRGVTVALSGDGGDELFGGYRRYRMHLHEEGLRSRIPFALRRSLFGPLGRYYPKADWAPQWLRAKTTFQSLSMDTTSAYFNSMSKLREDERQQLYSVQHKQQLSGYSASSVFHQALDGKGIEDPLKLIQYLDFKTWMPGDILTKVDRASMAHALEVRVPLLDHQFIEWAYRIPSSMNLRDGEGKFSFKKALEPHLSSDNLYRKKMGFSIPLAQWLRGPLAGKLKSTLLSEPVLDSGLFSSQQLQKMLNEHQSGRNDHADALWTLMMLGQFIISNENHSQTP